jgi:hypothetical protein
VTPEEMAVARIYGLPVHYMPHDQTYLVGGHRITAQSMELLMTQRPYKALSSAQLSNTLADQLAAGRVDATAFGERNKTYLASTPLTTTSPYFETNSKLWSQPVFTSTSNSTAVETVFRVGADGRPEAVTRLVDKPMPDSVRNAGESDLAWLKRRVSEICWSPT